MNKAKLIDSLVEKVNNVTKNEAEKINRKQAEKAVKSLTDIITTELKNGKEVSISGFGTFTSMTRYARGGVNPRNPKERITIPAVKVAKFRTGKNLKDALKS
jgi:DNA-binding protein HU-beta